MKFFWIEEGVADWASMGLTAFSNRKGTFVDATTIPETHRLKVVIPANSDTTTDTYKPSLDDNLKIVKRAARRSFILFKGETPIGWATFHRKPIVIPTDTDTDIEDNTEVEEEVTNENSEE